MKTAALVLAVVCAAAGGCARPPASAQPLGGTTTEAEPGRHVDRRASPASVSEDAGANDEVATIAPVATASAQLVTAPPPVAAGVPFEYTPLETGDTVQATMELGVSLTMTGDGAFEDVAGATELNADSTTRAKIRVRKASATEIDELEVEFSEGRLRTVFAGTTEEQTLNGEAYVVSFAGGTPSAKDRKGQAATEEMLPGLGLLLVPLLELQARMPSATGKRTGPGFTDRIALTRFAGLLKPPDELRVGPLELRLASVSGAAPNESARFDLELPVTFATSDGSARFDLSGTGTLPPRKMRPIELSLSGPVDGALALPDANLRLRGRARLAIRYDF